MYRRPWGPENVGEVGANVTSSHEEFLNEDDRVKKADLQRYLSAYAMQWLGLVGQREKFTLRETERVLRTSAMQIAEFDPREAAMSFEHLAQYAHNLLEQPWRVDFHVLKLTSGFYVHNVSAQLVNAHELLVAMGYVHVDEATLKLLPTFDLKRAKIMSRDCLVAAQECLILSQVWQRVADAEPEYPLTIGEVYEARAQFVGDTDTICKTLLADIRRRQYNDYKKKSMTFVPVEKLIDFDEVGGAGSPYRRREAEAERAAREVIRHTRAMHTSSSQSQVKNHRHEYDDVYFGSKREDSLSPMIPKTVKEFSSTAPSSSHKTINSGGVGRSSTGGGPMSFSKLKQDVPTTTKSSSSSSSGVLGAGDLYSDSYFPRVMRPTPQYPHQNQNSVEVVDGLVKEAYEYNRQVRNRILPHHQTNGGGGGGGGVSNSPSSEESSSPESTVEVGGRGYSTLQSSGEEDESKGSKSKVMLKSLDSVYLDQLLKQGYQETTPPLDLRSPRSSTNVERRRCLQDSVKDIVEQTKLTPSPPSPSKVDRDVIRLLEERVNALEVMTSSVSPSTSTSYVAPTPPSKSTAPQKPSPPPTTSGQQKELLTYSCRHCTFRNKGVETLVCSVCAKSQDFVDEDDPVPEVEPPKPKLYSVEEPKEVNSKHLECPQCTFLNPPIRRVCDMCNFRFRPIQSSPTPLPVYSSATLT